MIDKTQILPTLLIVIDFCAATVYFTQGDWRKTVYWLAAMALTTVVTY